MLYNDASYYVLLWTESESGKLIALPSTNFHKFLESPIGVDHGSLMTPDVIHILFKTILMSLWKVFKPAWLLPVHIRHLICLNQRTYRVVMSEHFNFHPILSPGESQVASKRCLVQDSQWALKKSKPAVRWKAFAFDMMYDMMLEGSIRKISRKIFQHTVKLNKLLWINIYFKAIIVVVYIDAFRWPNVFVTFVTIGVIWCC